MMSMHSVQLVRLYNDCLLREPQDQKARTLLEGCQREQRNMLEALAQVTTVDDRLSPQQRLAMVTTITKSQHTDAQWQYVK